MAAAIGSYEKERFNYYSSMSNAHKRMYMYRVLLKNDFIYVICIIYISCILYKNPIHIQYIQLCAFDMEE